MLIGDVATRSTVHQLLLQPEDTQHCTLGQYQLSCGLSVAWHLPRYNLYLKVSIWQILSTGMTSSHKSEKNAKAITQHLNVYKVQQNICSFSVCGLRDE